ncbi:MAG: histidine phosphatase family protein [Quisquiliibacterium sp.]
MKTELIMIRHGVTAWNKERRFQGQIDIPLDDEGLRQAQLLGQSMAGAALAAVYASDLTRARQTAEPLASAIGLPVVAEPGLRERHYGAFEGRTWDELQREHAADFARWRAREPDFSLPGGGETLLALHDRVETTMRALAARHPGSSVVAVTHGGVLDCAYRIATGLGMREPRQHDLLNASINRIIFDGERFSLVGWADVAHLRRAEDAIEGD